MPTEGHPASSRKVLKWGDNDQGGLARTLTHMFTAKTAGRNTGYY